MSKNIDRQPNEACRYHAVVYWWKGLLPMIVLATTDQLAIMANRAVAQPEDCKWPRVGLAIRIAGLCFVAFAFGWYAARSWIETHGL